MDAVLDNLSTSALVAASDANDAAYWLRRAHLAGWEIHDEGDIVWYRSGRRKPLANGVVRMRLNPETADAKIAITLAHFTDHSLPAAWFAGPAHRPADLGERLEAQGLRLVSTEPGMAVDLRSLRVDLLVPATLTVERMRDVDTLAVWLRTYRAGEDVPTDAPPILMESCVPRQFADDEPMRLFLARLDGAPVATAQLLLAAGVAGIYGVATVPEVRRRGIGAAVTRAALHDARALGYRVGVLHATEMGYSVYRGLGFAEYGAFSLYAWRPS
ncbi:MAG: GNAT family N-acetyltransferase [Ktedonobacterales bacterium]